MITDNFIQINNLVQEKNYKHLTDANWELKAHEYMRLKAMKKQLELQIEQVMKELVAGAKECNTVGFYHQLQKIERPGVINYKSIPQVEKILKKIDVEQYRGKSTVFWQLKTI